MRMARKSYCLSTVGFAFLFAGCSDPIPPAGQGAASIHFNKTNEDLCNPGIHWANAPYLAQGGEVVTATTSPASKLIDGQDGAQVSCRVAPSGGGFSVSGSLTGPATSQQGMSLQSTFIDISIPAIAENQAGAKGTLSVTDDKTLQPYGSGPDGCTFSVSPAAGEQLAIAAGRIWVKVSCDHMSEPGNASGATCNVDRGYVVLENCSQ
jgi:hypothetical protein